MFSFAENTFLIPWSNKAMSEMPGTDFFSPSTGLEEQDFL